MRIENDFIGEKSIKKTALYGINSLRAVDNFPEIVQPGLEWYKALGEVKKACYLTYKDFKTAALQKIKENLLSFTFIEDEIIEKLIESADEISEGKYFDNFVVPYLQGGAGTSINMNINEIIANVSLLKIGKQTGEYQIIDPFKDANVFQSTNDVVPTALKTASMKLLLILEDKINKLRFEIEKKETENRNTLRLAYTQLQSAVPSSYGKLFSTYNEALSRDWWRVSKCLERIKVVNLGGSAVGTSIAVPTFFVMNVAKKLRNITDLPVTSGENLSDATSNTDTFVEVHAILKAHAVNLEKIVNDIRLLASDICQNKEIEIPARQTGSSIMPGKVNPVIPEFVISTAHKIYSNDVLISSLSARGDLDLNAYLPVIGYTLLESISLLISANESLRKNMFAGLKVNSEVAENKLFASPAITTALIPYIGYGNAAKLAREMQVGNTDIFEANYKTQVFDEDKLVEVLETEKLLKTGFSIYDMSSI